MPALLRLRPSASTAASILREVFAPLRRPLAFRLWDGTEVRLGQGEPTCTVVVRSNARSLYYVLGGGKAVRYPVGVGRAGKQWSGTTFINNKMLRPAWVPPAVVRLTYPDSTVAVPRVSAASPAVTMSENGSVTPACSGARA